jgi:hypothetical protein
MHQVPTQCPICGDELRVTRLHCDGCDSTIEGQFALGRWLRLSPEQLAFANVFIKRRGKIKDVEDELGISYPTVVSRLNELIFAMGYDVEPGPPSDDGAPSERSTARQAILDRVASGELTPADAARQLRSM